MATCEYCKQEMTDYKHVITCSWNTEVQFPDGKILPSVPYQDEKGLRCHDCAIVPGGKHHPGCDMERCPKCGGQLISCGCLDTPHSTTARSHLLPDEKKEIWKKVTSLSNQG